ncbi:hypothetical protein MRB53_035117 [Persea americana]|uniref:Uncharacterized protein n=1 Tax=Persea americana TaxID=3435 RepID=A0ACC2K3S8_PERAE|nr:hypothetical protein MRB53_035117 [Persea americana]
MFDSCLQAMADGDPPLHTDSILTTLTNQITEALSKAQVLTQTTENTTTPIGIKLDGSNYALWSQVVEMYISGKDKLGYTNGNRHHRCKQIHPFENGVLIMPLSKDGS